MPYAVAVDIGGTNIRAGLLAQHGALKRVPWIFVSGASLIFPEIRFDGGDAYDAALRQDHG